jgi:hypothetical protein
MLLQPPIIGVPPLSSPLFYLTWSPRFPPAGRHLRFSRAVQLPYLSPADHGLIQRRVGHLGLGREG